MAETYSVRGSVSYTDGTPALGATAMAVDADGGADDPIGASAVRPDGSFELSATQAELGGAVEGEPEILLYLFRDGDLVHETVVEATPDATVDVTVDRPDPVSMERVMDAVCGMHHGMGEQRGVENVPRQPFHEGHGRFGRMFPHLEAADHDREFLQALGKPGGHVDEAAADRSVDHSRLPAGLVFFGQFVDHDITLDPLSSLARRNDPDGLRNFRTPHLDLDSVYGSGPETSPYLYESPFQGGHEERFLLADDGRRDLPRNREGVALIGDHRNDENHVLSQFQYAMLRFHNAIVEWLDDDCSDVFEEANVLARWHYHWIVLEEFLPATCDEDVVEDVREGRGHFDVGTGDRPYMPLEFSGAAYRFGHSQIRRRYRVNDRTEGKLFGHGDDALGMGFEAPSADEAVDWRYLFDLDDPDVAPQPAREIDPLVAPELLDLPFVDADDWRASLASRNLVRGRELGLPSGEAVARAIGEEPVSKAVTGFDGALADHSQPPDTETPLWYYVLAEAKVASDGETLGPVGSYIVAETLVGLIESSPSSFTTVQPGWTPTLPNPHSGAGEFTVADLLAFAFDGDLDPL